MERLHGGTLLGARGTGFVMFWDWESGEIVRRIVLEAKNVGFLRFLSLYSGSWSMERLHDGTLLGARCTGFVMFWD